MPHYSYSLVAKHPKGSLSRQESMLNMMVYIPHEGQPTNRELIEPALYHFDDLTIEDILSQYMLIAIEKCSDCEGCRNNLLSQRDHTNCDGGCLHNSELCEICNP
jgi:hypothetical protein